MSERDELVGRARDAVMRWVATGKPDLGETVADFAASERDLAWNEAKGLSIRAVHAEADARRIRPHDREGIIAAVAEALQRPQPPAQQDDKPSLGAAMHAGMEREYQQEGVVVFDIEARARELEMSPKVGGPMGYYHLEPWMSSSVAIALAREAHAAGRAEAAEAFALGVESISGATLDKKTTARWIRSHARPPQPAPETRAETPIETAAKRIALLDGLDARAMFDALVNFANVITEGTVARILHKETP